MKNLVFYFFLLVSVFSFSQEIVGITNGKPDNFVSFNGNVNSSVKIFRNTALSTPLDVTYTVTGSNNTNLSSGIATIPAYSQIARLDINPTAAPSSNETMVVTVTDVSNPNYNLEGRNSVSVVVTSQEPTKAFPNAEGAGAYAGSEIAESTWRGGDVYFVTNCNTTGAGSFQQALTSANSNGGGYVVIRVDCNIPLTSRLVAQNYSGVYIMGQTSPGDGMLFTGYNSPNGIFTLSDADNMLVRGINFVHGRRLNGGAIDAVSVFNATNIYVNHCSIFRWDDEAMSAVTTDDSKYTGGITFDYNMFGEGYWDPVNTSGTLNHNTASIMGGLSGNSGRNQIFTGNFSWNKNFGFNTSHRFPNFSGSIKGESNNNLLANHNYRIIQLSYPQPFVNWVNNYMQGGLDTDNLSDQPFSEANYYVAGNKFSRISQTFDDEQMAFMYANGNILEDSDGDILIDATDDSWLFNTYFFDIEFISQPFPRSNQLLTPTDVYGYTEIKDATTIRTELLSSGGAGASWTLDDNGNRVGRQNAWYQSRIDDVINRTIPLTIDVDDWLSDQPTSWSTNSTPYTDSDNDGMADTWEVANGLNVGIDDHNGHDLDANFENIEIFANGGVVSTPPTNTPLTDWNFDNTSLSGNVGNSFSAPVSFTPSNATDTTINYTSSNTSVATVASQSPLYTLLSEGTTTITGTSVDGSIVRTQTLTVNAVIVVGGRRILKGRFLID